jgi:site-specific DNA-methyltransferase (adenine-specific)
MLSSKPPIGTPEAQLSDMNGPEFRYALNGLASGVHQGDCLDVLTGFPDRCVDLIVTSPPYADQRASTYGGVKPDQYVEWFLPRAQQFFRVLGDRGSFVLNIKEKAINGERHTYVLELILALRQQGWLWTEEYIWHKKNCFPGKWPNRFRDAWERCLHFTKARQFKMNQEAVMVPMGDWAETRLRSLGKNDVVRYDSQVGNAFAKNIANWQGRSMAYPTNVLHMATECGNKSHSAAFPRGLPAWFINLFTSAGDMVLDPFVGSGTTIDAAVELGRRVVGIDTSANFVEMCRAKVAPAQMTLLQEPLAYAPKKPASGGAKVRRGKRQASVS